MRIKVPMTTVDLGPGVDSLGLALNRYLTVEVGPLATDWHVEHNLGAMIPSDDTNYIVAVATKLAPDLQPHSLTVQSEIPLQSGLGSSTAALVAGIELANQLGNLQLDDYTKLVLATRTEGHPGHVLPAILGGATVGYFAQGELYASGVVVPDYRVLIYKPTESLTHARAMVNGPAATMLLAAWQNGQVALAGRLIEATEVTTPALERVRQATHALDIYGTYLADTRGTVMVLVPADMVTDLTDVLGHMDDLTGTYEVVEIAPQGLVVE
ncbi:homoserine kinase [Weissella soli]|uniref:GHMP family kinase ATP-binding protein n=1 Tax=Weissella soli TaxID=155866 RepID=UPI003C70F304